MYWWWLHYFCCWIGTDDDACDDWDGYLSLTSNSLFPLLCLGCWPTFSVLLLLCSLFLVLCFLHLRHSSLLSFSFSSLLFCTDDLSLTFSPFCYPLPNLSRWPNLSRILCYPLPSLTFSVIPSLTILLCLSVLHLRYLTMLYEDHTTCFYCSVSLYSILPSSLSISYLWPSLFCFSVSLYSILPSSLSISSWFYWSFCDLLSSPILSSLTLYSNFTTLSSMLAQSFFLVQ
jgi:hypothetical protein